MKIQHRIWTMTAILGLAGAADAQINDATFKCQKIIEKAVEKFVDGVADPIEKCLLAVQKCDLIDEDDPAGCKAKLLVPDKGACAVGKLASDNTYFNGNSAFHHDPNSAAMIDKKYGKFIDAVGKCDIPNVDFASLGLPTPANAFELTDALNMNPTGAACLAHKRVKVTLPNRDALVTDLTDEPDGVDNVPSGFLFALAGPGSCK